jgi:PhzF family phenazine biosynthesis protein
VTPDGDLLLPVRDLATLRALDPDMRRLAALRTAQHARGVGVVSRETVEAGSETHCRFFAPHYGVAEDIVTGSVHSAIGAWLLEAGALPTGDGRVVFTAEQGDGLGRPGRLQVELTVAGGHAARVRVGGRAVTVLSGSLRGGS